MTSRNSYNYLLFFLLWPSIQFLKTAALSHTRNIRSVFFNMLWYFYFFIKNWICIARSVSFQKVIFFQKGKRPSYWQSVALLCLILELNTITILKSTAAMMTNTQVLHKAQWKLELSPALSVHIEQLHQSHQCIFKIYSSDMRKLNSILYDLLQTRLTGECN